MDKPSFIIGAFALLATGAVVTCGRSNQNGVDAGPGAQGGASGGTGGAPGGGYSGSSTGGGPMGGAGNGSPGNDASNDSGKDAGLAGSDGSAGVRDGRAADATTSADAAETGSIALADTCSTVLATALLTAWTADPHYCLIRFADGVAGARQLVFAPNGDLFVGGGGQVVVLFDTNHNGVSDPGERAVFAPIPGGNHGVALTATHLYASSDTTVYRFAYAAGQRAAAGAPEVVVHDIPSGGHVTRTLLIDGQNRLYVSIGSASNVDVGADPNTPPAMRAQIRRFDLGAIPTGGFAASGGELFAAGLRNEVGLALDHLGRLWGVENGRDDLHAGGDVAMHNDNPAEEINLFDVTRPGRNYGYPFCWSEGIWSGPTAAGTGTQHLDPDQPGAFTEARCQDPAVVVPPAFGLPAHTAPLDIVEYRGAAYPADLVGDLFVTTHGSWDRDVPVGRTIVRLHMGPSGPTSAQNFLGAEAAPGVLAQGTWSSRPVSIRVDAAGLLTFSDDSTGTVYKIGYRP